jgi:FG-GAP-like repeat
MRNLFLFLGLIVFIACKKIDKSPSTPITPVVQEEAIKFTTNLDTGIYYVSDTLPLSITVSSKLPSLGLIYSITSTWTDSSKQIFKLDSTLNQSSLSLKIPGFTKRGNYNVSVSVTSKSTSTNIYSKSITVLNKVQIKYQLNFNFDSLAKATGYEIANGPIIFDYDNNGRYDIIVNRRNMNRTATSYTYELLNPIVILDNGQIKQITNLWKGGTTSSIADINGDGFKDIIIMDNGPEFWDLNPNPSKTPITVYWNKKDGLDGSSSFVKNLYNGCFTINTLDINNDGKYEIMPMGNQFEDSIFYYNGTSFDKKVLLGLPNISQSNGIFDDFNNDKILDEFAYGFDKSGKLNLFKPTIIYNFNSPTSFNVVNLPDSQHINIAVYGDFKGNGLKDIIFICLKEGGGGAPVNNYHYYYYYENLGNGNFMLSLSKLPTSIIPKFSGYPMLYVAQDIDGDGDLDFYNVNSGMNLFFINDGKGNFSSGLK